MNGISIPTINTKGTGFDRNFCKNTKKSKKPNCSIYWDGEIQEMHLQPSEFNALIGSNYCIEVLDSTTGNTRPLTLNTQLRERLNIKKATHHIVMS